MFVELRCAVVLGNVFKNATSFEMPKTHTSQALKGRNRIGSRGR
ncbi:hypothetical protein DFR33_1281, partial [Bradymonas sediminis]